ncbi:AraC family transcriptional regulator [Flammeovirga sp. EKP202]|uniref:helix-turn-helix domain-containing protein n=1 Tax=Flammeovirga sp. EKP202 TaxID=2770592 RepID=UPI00165FFEEB|nr:helix-turn-helix domain-containing protein [Flammeovirga sp. EKP202]MBD0401791.1 AraC family transcriptional regulator [Flammeovirga sp. EKP202]
MDEIIKIDNISTLYEMIGRGKPKHPLVGILDFSKIDHKDYGNVKVSMGFYQIMLKNLCPGALRYGRKYYDFQEGTLTFMAPNQVFELENPDETKDVYGWSLIFHPDLIHGTTLSSKMKEYNFFSYDTYEALHLSDLEKQKLSDIIKDIELELENNIDKHSKTLIVSAIELLLNYCNRYYDRQFITRTEINKDVISKFEALLDEYFNAENLSEIGIPSIKYFAEKLHFSPNYLSDLLKKETGKNGTEHIQYHIIELAKDKLLSSTVSVSEIAYNLGFEYPQYFSKMFKKKTGMTPAEYRNFN